MGHPPKAFPSPLSVFPTARAHKQKAHFGSGRFRAYDYSLAQTGGTVYLLGAKTVHFVKILGCGSVYVSVSVSVAVH